MTKRRTTAVKQTRGMQTCALYTISAVTHNFPVNSKYVINTLICNSSVDSENTLWLKFIGAFKFKGLFKEGS